MPPKKPSDEDQLLSGPQVARKALPKSMRTKEGEEDSLMKRALFYLSGRAFVGGSWLMFFGFIMAIIFSILITLKGFMCPDISYAANKAYSFCPKQTAPQQQ